MAEYLFPPSVRVIDYPTESYGKSYFLPKSPYSKLPLSINRSGEIFEFDKKTPTKTVRNCKHVNMLTEYIL